MQPNRQCFTDVLCLFDFKKLRKIIENMKLMKIAFVAMMNSLNQRSQNENSITKN